MHLLGNPAALLDKVGSGVIEFFRAPADGFISDGLIGMGYGIGKGTEALMLGVVTGMFEFVQRITGAFCLFAADLSGVKFELRGEGGRAADPKQLLRGIAAAAPGVILRPYRGARAGGVLGFSKGLLSSVVGIASLKVS